MMSFLLTFVILFGAKSAFAASPSIVITEIAASKPARQEWIEIFNTTSSAMDITNWRLVEGLIASKPKGTRHKLKASQGDLIIEPKEYAIIANSALDFKKNYPNFAGTLIDSAWNSLNESGELIKLVDDQGSIIEAFTYISSPNGILQRIDPYLSDYSSLNWQEVIGDGSPGQANKVGSKQNNNQKENNKTVDLEQADNLAPKTKDRDQIHTKVKIKVLGYRVDKIGQAQNILQKINFQKVGQKLEIEPNKNQKNKIFKYLLSTAAALVIILVGSQVRNYRKK
jgi:hypothetical protein